jgi:hypothetical protein
MCPHTCCSSVAALLQLCPRTAVYVSSCCYMCVLILLYICVLILQYMCPHTGVSLSSCCCIFVLINIVDSAGRIPEHRICVYMYSSVRTHSSMRTHTMQDEDTHIALCRRIYSSMRTHLHTGAPHTRVMPKYTKIYCY